MKDWTPHIIYLLLLLVSIPAFSQVKVDTWIKDRPYMIGELMELNIKVERPQNIKVRWPFLVDTVGLFEIHSFTNIDSTIEGNLAMELQRVSLQVFDSGDYVFPPLAFEVASPGNADPDILLTDSLYIRVETVPVDTLGEIMAIKPPLDIPRTLWEKTRLLLIPLVALLLLGLLIWFFIRRRKTEDEEEVIVVDKRGLDTIYYEKLHLLRSKKYPEEGKIKAYYVELTDIVREYIEQRYGIAAMEMTSTEVATAIKAEKSVNKARHRAILNMMTTADLVKFAKGRPPSSYHEESYQAAKTFIEETYQKELKEENNTTT